jgi:hypothetical protein
VPAMKVTPNAAMRARDVSRPHPEHLAEAEAAEARYPRGRAAPAEPGPQGGTKGNRTGDSARADERARANEARDGARGAGDGARGGRDGAQGGGDGMRGVGDGARRAGDGARGGADGIRGVGDGARRAGDGARGGGDGIRGDGEGGRDGEGRRRRRITRAGRGRPSG